jgi:acetolactate synthase-1/2/3 large subunit
LIALAERLEAPVSSTFQGKGVVPESHPLFLWPGFGAAAPPFVQEIVRGCDATLAIGCKFGEVATGSYGAIPRVRSCTSTSRETSSAGTTPLRSASPETPRRSSTCFRAAPDAPGRIRSARGGSRRGTRRSTKPRGSRAGREASRPGLLLRALQSRFGPDTIYTTDSGNGTFLAIELLKLERPGQLLAPVDYSCMGYAVPAAIGAKLARPTPRSSLSPETAHS